MNIQNHQGRAKAYQVKQVLLAIEKLEVDHSLDSALRQERLRGIWREPFGSEPRVLSRSKGLAPKSPAERQGVGESRFSNPLRYLQPLLKYPPT